MKRTVVLYPIPSMGHLVPMLQLAKHFTLHGFSVTVVLMDCPFKLPFTEAFLGRVSSTCPSVSLHQLPPISSLPNPAAPPIIRILDAVRLNNPQLRHFLSAHSQTSDGHAVVVLDWLCTYALDVTTELRLPSYYFFPAGAATLISVAYLPTINSTTDDDFKNPCDARLHFPGLPPIPASDMPRELIDRDSDTYKGLLPVFERLGDADGILVNTFESLEGQAVKVLRDGACVPGRRMPPVYCIGPLVSEGSRGDKGPGKEEKAECLVWLDSQPHRSVVFLCFGSMGTFPVEQLKEIAAGLERSDHRFLWVVRAPRAEKEGPPEEPQLDALLPEGFVERTKERGLVVKSWAPQVEVLNHEAVGGFVTHCGWNSTLEAVTAGVAMVAWPLYAEQRMNKIILVEQMRLAVAMEGHDKELVVAEEVEAKVRWLMQSEGGRELRERATAMKKRVPEEWSEGGSSHRAWTEMMDAFNISVNKI